MNSAVCVLLALLPSQVTAQPSMNAKVGHIEADQASQSEVETTELTHASTKFQVAAYNRFRTERSRYDELRNAEADVLNGLNANGLTEENVGLARVWMENALIAVAQGRQLPAQPVYVTPADEPLDEPADQAMVADPSATVPSVNEPLNAPAADMITPAPSAQPKAIALPPIAPPVIESSNEPATVAVPTEMAPSATIVAPLESPKPASPIKDANVKPATPLAVPPAPVAPAPATESAPSTAPVELVPAQTELTPEGSSRLQNFLKGAGVTSDVTK